MLFEKDALDDLLETLEPELKNQLKFLIFQFDVSKKLTEIILQ